MFTMAEGGRFVTDWAGDPGAVIDYGVRFSSMVVVPDDDSAEIVISGKIEDKLEDNTVVVAHRTLERREGPHPRQSHGAPRLMASCDRDLAGYTTLRLGGPARLRRGHDR